jgi:hypothetical protein
MSLDESIGKIEVDPKEEASEDRFSLTMLES